MKCIQFYRTSTTPPTIQRVTNEEADIFVSDGRAFYIPKNIWKMKVRKRKSIEPSTNCSNNND